MIKLMKRLWQDRRGNALVIAGAALPLLVGSAGLATDTIQWTMWKRQLQRAADSGAFAGVYGHIQGQTVTDAVNRDLFHNNKVGIDTVVDIQNSPSSGPYSVDPNAVRVTLSVQKKLGFTSIFMAAAPTITATATATIVPNGEYCVISLENTSTTGITATGSATVDMGCGMATNSTSLTAAVATGGSAVLATPIAAVGGINSSNNWGPDTVLLPFSPAQDDPFAHINPATPTGSCPNVNVGPSATVTLSPGCYGNMTFQGTVHLNPGTYVLDGGSLKINAQAKVYGMGGVTFVLTTRTNNASNIGTVDINGGAEVQLAAPNSGTYKDLIIYQDRRAVNGNNNNTTNLINGNSNSIYHGSFYFPNQETRFNGTSGMQTKCMQLVARRVNFSGNTNVQNDCPPGEGGKSFKGRSVRLVA
ncbi:MAG TPA: pilus assembly protein TadG-related protein [Sphingomicrobium sp.]|nr:pilus assembly protein TadG-related protein [Sphingomicrobium sp.]